uniref:Vesicular, overexpressed in cancer, prosurvival protein 1 n=1 Tax=Macrostomum lignano TaxID=282301 RepID=A0A1I8FA34_9PLAT
HKPECISCSSCSSEPRNEPGTLCGLGAGGPAGGSAACWTRHGLNQLFCRLRSLFLAALKMPPSFLPAAARSCLAGSTSGVGWSPTAGPNCAGFSLNSWTVAADGSKAVRLLAEVAAGAGRRVSSRPACARPIAPLNGSTEVAPPPPAAAPSGPVQGAGPPLRRNRLLPRLRRSLAYGQPCVGQTEYRSCASPTPVPQPCFFCLSHPLPGESPHQTVVEFVRRVLQTDYAEPPSAELRPVHPAPSPAARPVGLCCILNIDRYEQADAPTQIPQAQGSACDSNTTDEPDLLNDSRESASTFVDECFDEFGAVRRGSNGAHRPVMLNELMASVNRQLTQQNDDGIPLQPS